MFDCFDLPSRITRQQSTKRRRCPRRCCSMRPWYLSRSSTWRTTNCSLRTPSTPGCTKTRPHLTTRSRSSTRLGQRWMYNCFGPTVYLDVKSVYVLYCCLLCSRKMLSKKTVSRPSFLPLAVFDPLFLR